MDIIIDTVAVLQKTAIYRFGYVKIEMIWNQTYYVYKLVKSEWFLRHRKQIQILPEKTIIHGCIVITKEEKQKFHRNIARARKENYLEQCRKS